MTDAAEPDAVVVAYVYNGADVTYSFHHSIVELIGYDLAHHARILRGGYIAYKASTDGLADARNKVVAAFLTEHRADWLLWLDTDMGFGPDTLEVLYAAADPAERPIMGALAFSQREETSDGMGGWRCRATPTIFDWLALDDGQMGFAVRFDYPTGQVVRCAGTGSACILIHRSVFERIEAKYGPDWYTRVPNATMGQVVSEDLSLCLRAGTLNIPVHVHTGVKTTHQKRLWLAEDDFFAQVALAKLSQQRPVAPPPPPATDPVAVVVPVLGRPEHAEPFMASVRASTGLATVYAVCDRDDEQAIGAWKQAGALTLDLDNHLSVATKQPLLGRDRPGTFAEKVNIGYRYSDEPWLFIVGSDVRFYPGWLDHAQAAAGERFHVVGTNDLGNPRVTSGEHATHLLIRRSYVDEIGASWDGPGIVAHEGYGHWWVDDEIVMAAKQRGVWTPALDAVVEHLHPLWGKADDDEVYRLGQAHAEADRARFEDRCRTNL